MGLPGLWTIADMLNYHVHLFSHVREGNFLALEVFHTAEFLALFGWIAFYSNLSVLKGIFWGMMLHMAVDEIHLWRHGISFKRARSFLEYALRCRHLKKAGVDIQRPFENALNDFLRSRTLKCER